MTFRKAFFLTLLLVLSSCYDSRYDATAEDFSGPNGEAPKSLIVSYEKTFVVEEKRYVKAMGEAHQFLRGNSFLPIYNQCFSDVLDLHVISNVEKLKTTFPCIAIHAAYRGELHTIYFTAKILNVGSHEIGGKTPVTVEVRLYGKDPSKTHFENTEMKNLIREFTATVEPHL